MSRAQAVIVFALACCAGGCPKATGTGAMGAGSDGDSSGGSSAGNPCDEWKAWKQRCDPNATADDLDYYDECRVLKWDKVKPEYTRATASCLSTLSCERNDDTCSSMGYMAIGVSEQSASQDMLVQECLHAISGCDIADDICFNITALISSGRAEVTECSVLACDDYVACLADVFGAPVRND